MKTYLKTMSDDQMRDLLKIRINNEAGLDFGFSKSTIEKIEIESRYGKDNPYGFSAIVYTKEYAPEKCNIHLDKFYLNEVEYMVKENIVVFD